MTLSIRRVWWILTPRLCPKSLMTKLKSLQSFDSKAEQSCVFIAVTSLGCLRARWQLYCTAATAAGFRAMHVNESVRLNWVSQSCAFAPENKRKKEKAFLPNPACVYGLFFQSGQHSAQTLHSFLPQNLRKFRRSSGSGTEAFWWCASWQREGLFGSGQMTVAEQKGLYSEYWVPLSQGIILFETGPEWVLWVDVENLHEQAGLSSAGLPSDDLEVPQFDWYVVLAQQIESAKWIRHCRQFAFWVFQYTSTSPISMFWIGDFKSHQKNRVSRQRLK